MKLLIPLICGILFALGLGVSGMTQPHIVRGFLDILGAWDWRLIGVMAGAIGVHAITYHLIVKRSSPFLDSQFHLPKNNLIDKKLIIGAVIFGLGWGWTGICPGPGLVAVVSGQLPFIYFVGSMLLGMKLYQWLNALIKIK